MIIYLQLLSEIYLSFFFFFIFTLVIFINLSKVKNFPNYYNSICFSVFTVLLNQLVIDIWNRNDECFSYDLFKNSADIYFKYFLILISLFYLVYSNFYINKMYFNDFENVILVLFILLSFNFFYLTNNVISFYLLLEIQSFGFYLLTALNKRNQYSIESGLKYFVLSSFSSIILLFGFSFLYGITGTLNFNDYYLFFLNVVWNQNILIIYIFNILLIVLAILFKLYVAPFHIWISDIYQGAPTSSTAFFATITNLPLFYFFSKFYLIFFSIIEKNLYYFLFGGVVLSMIIGTIGAIYQKKIKRLIAFSSVSSIGYILIGFLEENPLLLSNAFTYFIIYIINTIGILIIFLNLYLKKLNFFLERFSLLSGFIFKNKLFSFILVSFFFSVAGMPPFSLFFAKILLLSAVSYSIYTILFFVIVFVSILSCFYYLKIIKTITFDKNNNYLFISQINYVNLFIISFLFIFTFLIIWNIQLISVVSDYIVLLLYI